MLSAWRDWIELHMPVEMGQIGTRIDELGTLLREEDGFVLRRDLGGRWRLDLHRVQGATEEMRVRVTGTVVEDDLVDVDGIDPEAAFGVAA